MMKFSSLLVLPLLCLTVASAQFPAFAENAGLNPNPTSVGTNSLENLVFEYRKELAEQKRLSGQATQSKVAYNAALATVDNFVRINAGKPQTQVLSQQFDKLVTEMKRLKSAMDISAAQQEQSAKRLSIINAERLRIRGELAQRVKALNDEAKYLNTQIRYLN